MIKKKLKECWDYEEKFGNLALARVELDFDDGVKYNYKKVEHWTDGMFYVVLADSKYNMMDWLKVKRFQK